eukprot:TRINITY_DN1297_c0_g3_i1.p1 TRINITY_DN1297_c0_g3~~TRINITY_DN1297_c0_g3_i1.p1  ORF type:complete len:470 (+),score=37.32 TRINITY_DN1297_c0_g3_i1:70-1479(+)
MGFMNSCIESIRRITLMQCLWILIFIAVILLFILTSILLYSLKDFKERHPSFFSDVDNVSYFLLEQHGNPINSLISTTEKCPKGTKTLTLPVWGGYRQGCYCKRQNDNNETTFFECMEWQATRAVSAGGCTKNSNAGGRFPRWRGLNLCVTRNSKVGFNEENCQPGFVRCPDQYTCVPSAETCPINKITVKSDSTGQIVSVTGEIDFSNTNPNKFPITSLAVSFAPYKCALGSEVVYEKYYPMFKQVTNCSYGTLRTSTIGDKAPSVEQLKTISSNVEREFPMYTQYYSDMNAYLMTIRPENFNRPGCFSPDEMEDLRDKIKSLQSFLDIMLVVMVILGGITAVLVAVGWFAQQCDMRSMNTVIAIIFIAVWLIGLPIVLSFGVRQHSKVNSFQSQIKDIASRKCLNTDWDNYFEKVCDPTETIYKDSKSYFNLAVASLVIFFFIVAVGVIIYIPVSYTHLTLPTIYSV